MTLPNSTSWTAFTTAWNPDPHSLLTVSAVDEMGTPAFKPMCRARYAASDELCMTLPNMTDFTCVGSSCASSNTAVVDFTARSVADTSLKAPPNAPNAVRRAPQMYTARDKAMLCVNYCVLG